MPFVTTQKVGTTYSLSGNNITPSVTVGDTTTAGKIGGINVGSLSNGVPAMIQTDTTVTSSGSAFSKTESVIMGDATPSAVTPFGDCSITSIRWNNNCSFGWYSRKPCTYFIKFWSPYLHRRWIRYILHRIY